MPKQLTQQERLARAPNKYGNRRTIVDNITFASKREAERYKVLKLLEKGGAIKELVLQPRYPLKVNGVNIGTYVADFSYIEEGIAVTEDVKGVRLPIYRLKAKLMRALYDIVVRET